MAIKIRWSVTFDGYSSLRKTVKFAHASSCQRSIREREYLETLVQQAQARLRELDKPVNDYAISLGMEDGHEIIGPKTTSAKDVQVS